MKPLHHLVLILIFAFGALFPGCASKDSSSKSNVQTDSKQPIRADNNANNTYETPLTEPPQSAAPIQQNNSAPAVEADKPAKMSSESSVTMQDFNKLKTGMSYKQVAAILGLRGSSTGEFKTQSGSMAMYSWKGKGKNGDWNVTARFDNGKLFNKVQVGLR